MTHPDLTRLLAPRSVAIAGASDKNYMSMCVYRNLIRHGYDGEVHVVNPNQATVHGAPATPSLGDIDHPVDLLFSLLSAPRVPAVVEEAAALGIRNVVVLAGGFAEEGPRGSDLQDRIVRTARARGMRVLGPNTIGFLNLHANTVLYGSPLEPPAFPDQLVRKGGISAVVQSGVIAHTLIRAMLSRRGGLATLVGVGNEADVRVHDVIEHLVDDPDTKVIALFLETVRDHAAFRRACLRAAAAGKPIVALKAGRSKVGAATAVTHTGALAGDEQLNQAAFRQLGVVSVSAVEELAATCIYIAEHGVPPGRRVGFIANSGGFCEIFADRAEEVGIEMPPLDSETLAKLREILPPSAGFANPVDTTGLALTDLTLFPRTIDCVARDPNIDVLFVGRNPWRAEVENAASIVERYEPLGRALAAARIPVQLISDSWAPIIEFEERFAKNTGLTPEVGGVFLGLRAFATAAEWQERRARAVAEAAAHLMNSDAIVRQVEARPMAEHEVLSLLQSAGVSVVPWKLATTLAEATRAAEAFGYPAVLKISSAHIPHKSAIGGVVLDIADGAGMQSAWNKVMSCSQAEHLAVDGALVMPMRPAGIELIVGVKRDPTWGHALLVGLGGVWTEVLHDTQVCPLPATHSDVREMLMALKAARVFAGGHGIPPADLDAAAHAVLGIAELARSLGSALDALEVNPLRVSGAHVEALDGLVRWAGPDVGRSASV